MSKWHPDDLKRKANEFMNYYNQGDDRCELVIFTLSLYCEMTERAVLNKIKRISEGDAVE